MIYIFSNKNRCKSFFALILLLTLFLFFRLHRKLKISCFFLFRSKLVYEMIFNSFFAFQYLFFYLCLWVNKWIEKYLIGI